LPNVDLPFYELTMEQKIATMLAAGDNLKAFELMAQAYSMQIGRFCTGLVGLFDADDMLQETFIQAYKSLGTYRAESSVKSWLFGIAKKVCASHLRKKDRRSSLIKRYFGGKEENSTAKSKYDPSKKIQETSLAQQALLKLKPNQREAILLKYQIGMTNIEISETLNITPTNARKRISLGIKNLKEILKTIL
jgi:RNA polymerase sigma-70 factor, ECF subfamily